MKQVAKIFLLVTLSNILFSSEPYKMAFGSCLHQNYPAPIWTSVEEQKINSFYFLGDNVYGDTPSGIPWKLKSSYELQKLALPKWLANTEILSIWDDHDYGKNDAGGTYVYKQKAESLYLDFWNIPIEDERHKRDGIYFSETKLINGNKILFIGLDTRYFRSDIMKSRGIYQQNTNADATILGQEQWRWLEQTLEQDFDFLVLATSIQVLATEHRFEKWNNIPKDRTRLINLLNKLPKQKLIISGDRHRGGVYKLDNLIEVTSSSLNRGSSYQSETDALLIGETYSQNNYGLLTFNQNSVLVELIDQDNNILESISISF